jgi:hypothetical protein
VVGRNLSDSSSLSKRNTYYYSRRFDGRAAREPSYPSEIPSVGDYVSHDDQESSSGTEDEGYSSDIEILHAPPGFVSQHNGFHYVYSNTHVMSGHATWA